jgi:hypothetical protein
MRNCVVDREAPICLLNTNRQLLVVLQSHVLRLFGIHDSLKVPLIRASYDRTVFSSVRQCHEGGRLLL